MKERDRDGERSQRKRWREANFTEGDGGAETERDTHKENDGEKEEQRWNAMEEIFFGITAALALSVTVGGGIVRQGVGFKVAPAFRLPFPSAESGADDTSAKLHRKAPSLPSQIEADENRPLRGGSSQHLGVCG